MRVAITVMAGTFASSGKTGHVDHSAGDALNVHHWFDRYFAVWLHDALFHVGGHVGVGVADVDLAAGDVVFSAVESGGFGEAGDRMLGRRVGSGIGRGAAAEIEPLLMIRPPCGRCLFIRRKASRVQR